jgi:dolichol-phosphate mannosyltransferase
MKIGFILPCYNEYENIFILINQIKKVIKNPLIVVVDDSSNDDIKKKIKKYKKVKYFKRIQKSGRGTAVILGMKKILKENIDLIVEMDTDLSSHPRELPKNFKHFKKNNLDLLVMSRYLKKSVIKNWPVRRRVFSILSNKLAQFLLGVNVSDYTMGYRIYSRRAANHVVRNCGKVGSGFIVLSEILAELNSNNFKIGDVPTVFTNREKGKSSVNLKLVYQSLIGLFKIYFIQLKKNK